MRTLEELWSDPSLEPSTPTTDCPSGERLADLVRGELPLAERERLVDHLVACAACSRSVQALQSVGVWSLAAGEGLEAAASQRAAGSGARVRWAVAAALLAAAGLGWLAGGGRRSSPVPDLVANAPIVDLLPAGALRAAVPLASATVRLSSPGGPPTVLVVHLENAVEGKAYVADLRRQGISMARLEGLVAGRFGTLTMILQGTGLSAGEYELEVRESSREAAPAVARYSLHLEHAD